jgi:hypothetical protein
MEKYDAYCTANQKFLEVVGYLDAVSFCIRVTDAPLVPRRLSLRFTKKAISCLCATTSS